MVVKEKLYNDVPPTQLRGKEEAFKPAKTNKFWLTVASLFFFNMLQNRFYAFRYNGVENYKIIRFATTIVKRFNNIKHIAFYMPFKVSSARLLYVA